MGNLKEHEIKLSHRSRIKIVKSLYHVSSVSNGNDNISTCKTTQKYNSLFDNNFKKLHILKEFSL